MLIPPYFTVKGLPLNVHTVKPTECQLQSSLAGGNSGQGGVAAGGALLPTATPL
jgi:hypothetical protein